MTVQASPQEIREMEQSMRLTSAKLEKIAEVTRAVAGKTADWNDAQGAEFQRVMREVAMLVEQPVSPLQAAVPKLESIAALIEQYESSNFR